MTDVPNGVPSVFLPELTAQKRGLRERMLARRQAEGGGTAAERAGRAVAQHFLGGFALESEEIVAGYWPMRDELDPRPLLGTLADHGQRLVLPVIEASGRPLLFRSWRPGEALKPGRFGTSMPSSEEETLQPGFLLVPLLAFDRRGFRLGYGGGFYDRTLETLRGKGRIRAVGLAFSFQEVPSVPNGLRDHQLDAVVTERGIERFSSGRR